MEVGRKASTIPKEARLLRQSIAAIGSAEIQSTNVGYLQAQPNEMSLRQPLRFLTLFRYYLFSINHL